jgi:hypothetical protein
VTTDTTVIAALVHYGLSCYDGRHCIEALRDLGHDQAADVLKTALSGRVYSAPGVRAWEAEA